MLQRCSTACLAQGRLSPLYELLFARSPDCSHLPTFGCQAYVGSPPKHIKLSDKLEPRATYGMAVGYSCAERAYRVLWEEGVSDWYPLQRVVLDESAIGAAALGWSQSSSDHDIGSPEQWEPVSVDSTEPVGGADLPSSDGGPPPPVGAPPARGAPPQGGGWGPQPLPAAGTDDHLDAFDSARDGDAAA